MGGEAYEYLVYEVFPTFSDVSPSEMPSRSVGRLHLNYPSNFSPNVALSEKIRSSFPESAKSLIDSVSSYAAEPSCGLGQVNILETVYARQVQGSVDGAANGAIQKISALEGVANPRQEISQVMISGYPARRVTYAAERWSGTLGAEMLVIYDATSNTMWQVQLVFASKEAGRLRRPRECADGILHSVFVENAP